MTRLEALKLHGDQQADQVARLIARAAEQEGHCVLCGQPARMLGVLVPHDSRRFGAPAGKVRLVAYRLCPVCEQRPDALERVEDWVLRQVSTAMN